MQAVFAQEVQCEEQTEICGTWFQSSPVSRFASRLLMRLGLPHHVLDLIANYAVYLFANRVQIKHCPMFVLERFRVTNQAMLLSFKKRVSVALYNPFKVASSELFRVKKFFWESTDLVLSDDVGVCWLFCQPLETELAHSRPKVQPQFVVLPNAERALLYTQADVVFIASNQSARPDRFVARVRRCWRLPAWVQAVCYCESTFYALADNQLYTWSWKICPFLVKSDVWTMRLLDAKRLIIATGNRLELLDRALRVTPFCLVDTCFRDTLLCVSSTGVVIVGGATTLTFFDASSLKVTAVWRHKKTLHTILELTDLRIAVLTQQRTTFALELFE